MSYNVRVFDLYNWSNNLETRNKIFQLIRSESPDVACFQEYYNQTDGKFAVHDSLMNNQRFKYSHIYYTDVINERNSRFGIATYSVYPIVNKEVLRYGSTRNLSIVSDVKIGKDTVRIFNNHLQSIHLKKEDYHFLDSLRRNLDQNRIDGAKGVYARFEMAFELRSKQVRTLVEEIKNSPYPVVFCGDFNDTPSSYTYKQIAELLNDSHRTNGKWAGNTYARFFPSFRIDYIFYSDKLQCLDFGNRKVKLSDHYPVIGNYVVR